MMQFQPAYDLVLIELDRFDEEKKRQGIITPGSGLKMDFIRATILEVGWGKLNTDGQMVPLRYKKGDRILISPVATMELGLDFGKYVRLIKESEIAGKILKEDDICVS